VQQEVVSNSLNDDTHHYYKSPSLPENANFALPKYYKARPPSSNVRGNFGSQVASTFEHFGKLRRDNEMLKQQLDQQTTHLQQALNDKSITKLHYDNEIAMLKDKLQTYELQKMEIDELAQKTQAEYEASMMDLENQYKTNLTNTMLEKEQIEEQNKLEMQQLVLQHENALAKKHEELQMRLADKDNQILQMSHALQHREDLLKAQKSTEISLEADADELVAAQISHNELQNEKQKLVDQINQMAQFQAELQQKHAQEIEQTREQGLKSGNLAIQKQLKQTRKLNKQLAIKLDKEMKLKQSLVEEAEKQKATDMRMLQAAMQKEQKVFDSLTQKEQELAILTSDKQQLNEQLEYLKANYMKLEENLNEKIRDSLKKERLYNRTLAEHEEGGMTKKKLLVDSEGVGVNTYGSKSNPIIFSDGTPAIAAPEVIELMDDDSDVEIVDPPKKNIDVIDVDP